MSAGGTDFEYEIYLPVRDNEGHSYPGELFERFKKLLTGKFGGLTDTQIHNKGIWQIGNVQHRDEVVVWRVLSIGEGLKETFMKDFRAKLELELRQDRILIVRRIVQII